MFLLQSFNSSNSLSKLIIDPFMRSAMLRNCVIIMLRWTICRFPKHSNKNWIRF